MSRQPDYDLSVLNKDNDKKSRVGAGWINPDGSIGIALNPFVVLDGNMNLAITLFKHKSKEQWQRERERKNQSEPGTFSDDDGPPAF